MGSCRFPSRKPDVSCFYVYRPDGSPYWVTALLTKTSAGGLDRPPAVFSGDVYETRGPWFAAPFNPTAVLARKVGTATFVSSDGFSANLQYSIDGVVVSKTITRLTVTNINYSGQYLGGTVLTAYNCKVPANNQAATGVGLLTIAHTADSFRLTAELTSSLSVPDKCVFNGVYSQKGSIGAVTGTYSCSSGNGGTFSLDGMQWSLFGVSAHIYAKDQHCEFSGAVGGITESNVN